MTSVFSRKAVIRLNPSKKTVNDQKIISNCTTHNNTFTSVCKDKIPFKMPSIHTQRRFPTLLLLLAFSISPEGMNFFSASAETSIAASLRGAILADEIKEIPEQSSRLLQQARSVTDLTGNPLDLTCTNTGSVDQETCLATKAYYDEDVHCEYCTVLQAAICVNPQQAEGLHYIYEGVDCVKLDGSRKDFSGDILSPE